MVSGDRIWQDLAYALRRLRRSPVFAVVAVLTLAAGIGVSTAVFSLVDAVLLRPLQITDPARVVVLWPTRPSSPGDQAGYSMADYRDLRSATRAFSVVSAIDAGGAFPQPVGPAATAEPVNAIWVGGSFTQALGVAPLVGEGLEPADSHIGAPRKVLISYRYWQRAYGGKRAVIGRTLSMLGTPHTIVGVLPRGFDFPRGTDVWVPVPDTLSGVELAFVGRLAPGATAAQARAEVDALISRSDSPDPVEMRDVRARSTSVLDAVVGPARPIMIALGAGVSLLLLMTGVNVATLVLGRAVSREREASVRLALGASGRLAAAGLLSECVILALLGGAAGVGAAEWVLRGMLALAPPELPRLDAVAIDWRALGYVAFVSLALAISLAGAGASVPSPAQLGALLRSRASRGGARRWPRRLVVSQVAIAMVVMAGAGLTLRSLEAMTHVNLGFASDHLIIARLFPASAGLQTDSAWRRAVSRATAAVGATPGVAAATPMIAPPFTGKVGFDNIYLAEGQAASAAQTNPLFALFTATPTTMQTLGIPLVAGRHFTDTDREGHPLVAIVSAGMARTLWPGRDPIGRRIRSGDNDPWKTVVGVAGDTRYRDLESVRPAVYLPDAQAGIGNLIVAVRTRGNEDAMIPTIRRVISGTEPGVGLVGVAPVIALAGPVLARPRFAALLLTAVAGAALLLAAAGLYGALATLVEERRQELGIRLALGALPRDVAALVVRQGATLALLGATIGTMVALAGTRVLRALLFGVTPTDPLTFIGVAGVLAIVAVLACVIPARRATRVDPLTAIRSE